ncbi:MAG: tRNA 2-selenouridine(34) synthase MnmH [Clostridiaceae bacterium]|nr:tRNA 2-selenouridine(34) synthase MnmH [Clostridiaceae bacterium]
MIKINVEDVIYRDSNNVLFIDLRSPYEFNEGTIPGAINIPLFNNEERIEIGKLYKNKGIEDAKYRGVELTANKLPHIYKHILELSKVYSDKDIILFCARGGLRSTSLLGFLNNLGIKVYQLVGGYKAFRKFSLDYLDNIKKHHEFLVLHGYTGVGKTKIINMLKTEDTAAINMVFLAKNTGSVFGNIIFPKITITQKMFEGLLVYELVQCRKRLIIVESESKRIGAVSIPNCLYELIVNGRHILVNTGIENRVARLVEEYVGTSTLDDTALISSVQYLKKGIGKENVEKYIEYIKNKKYNDVARQLIINYYDPLYKHSIAKYNYHLHINYDTIELAVKQIKKYYFEIEEEINQ